MTDSEARTRTTAVETKGAPTVDMKLEVVVIPVSDVDRAKAFYERPRVEARRRLRRR